MNKVKDQVVVKMHQNGNYYMVLGETINSQIKSPDYSRLPIFNATEDKDELINFYEDQNIYNYVNGESIMIVYTDYFTPGKLYMRTIEDFFGLREGRPRFMDVTPFFNIGMDLAEAFKHMELVYFDNGKEMNWDKFTITYDGKSGEASFGFGVEIPEDRLDPEKPLYTHDWYKVTSLGDDDIIRIMLLPKQEKSEENE